MSRNQGSLPRRSPLFFRVFRKYARRFIRKNFHAFRIDGQGAMPDSASRPLIVVMNHASWWDPLVALVLSESTPPMRTHFAPMDAKGLEQYRTLEFLGIFGVELGTTRGSLAFLRQCMAVLARPESVLWITPQGRFVDVRERPTRFKEGLGRLLHRVSQVDVVPLAIEYPFWNDRRPEVLVRFGPLIPVEDGASRSPKDWTRSIEQALEETQDRLAEASRARDPAAFITLIGGTAGVGGLYDLGRRFMSTVRGETFRSEHQISNLSDESKP